MKKKVLLLIAFILSLIIAIPVLAIGQRSNNLVDTKEYYDVCFDGVCDDFIEFVECDMHQNHPTISLEAFDEALALFAAEFFANRSTEHIDEAWDLFMLEQGAIPTEDGWYECEYISIGHDIFGYCSVSQKTI